MFPITAPRVFESRLKKTLFSFLSKTRTILLHLHGFFARRSCLSILLVCGDAHDWRRSQGWCLGDVVVRLISSLRVSKRYGFVMSVSLKSEGNCFFNQYCTHIPHMLFWLRINGRSNIMEVRSLWPPLDWKCNSYYFLVSSGIHGHYCKPQVPTAIGSVYMETESKIAACQPQLWVLHTSRAQLNK